MKYLILLTLLITFTGCAGVHDRMTKEWEKIDKMLEREKNDNN